MGYTEGPNMFNGQDYALQQEWESMLSSRSEYLFGSLLPHQKIPSYVCSFLDMPQADQLYVCGLLSKAQHLEMSLVSKAYQDECKQVICENYEIDEQDEQIRSILPPTFYEIQNRLMHRSFHDPMIHRYVEIVEKMEMASIVYDLSTLNYEKRRFDFDDGQEVYDILVPQNEFSSDLKALEACLLIRNGCLNVPEQYDAYLNGAVDYFCEKAVSDLSAVPENEWTLGASKRGRVAFDMFSQIFKKRGVVLSGKPEGVMAGVLKRTAALLSCQEQFEEGWRGYLVDWFNQLMGPYADSLVERCNWPQKVIEASMPPSIKEDGREERN